MEILSAAQMRATDRYAIETLKIPSLILMEGAAHALCSQLQHDYPTLLGRGVWILCGKGNNGGDGFALARLLLRKGIGVTVLATSPLETLSPDAAVQWPAASGSGVRITTRWPELHDASDASPGLIVDALLGTGIQGGAREPIATVIREACQTRIPIVAVDVPSGLDSDAWDFSGEAVQAHATYTLCRPKPALLSAANRKWVGKLSILPIGIPDAAVHAARSNLEWLDAATCAPLLGSRPRDSHKGTFGHLGLFAGSPNMSGAALLAGRAALRAGVGLATVFGARREGTAGIGAPSTPELMHRELPFDEEQGYVESLPATQHTQLDALAVGPGLGQLPGTQEQIRETVREFPKSLVLDADGLNAFAQLAGWQREHGETILTPHPGEASRLLGRSTAEIQSDRVASALEIAERTGAVVLLKGASTVVASPCGKIGINSTGNPGLATAGSGDVLTGLLGALLAQGLSAWDAARLGSYLHGLAGDRVRDRLGEQSLIASDLISTLPRAIEDLHSFRRTSRW